VRGASLPDAPVSSSDPFSAPLPRPLSDFRFRLVPVLARTGEGFEWGVSGGALWRGGG
jgi:hypothetical protein